MPEITVCRHCHNPVELIVYKEDGVQLYGTVANEYRHARPRPYPVCSKNPITSEDIESVDEEAV